MQLVADLVDAKGQKCATFTANWHITIEEPLQKKDK